MEALLPSPLTPELKRDLVQGGQVCAKENRAVSEAKLPPREASRVWRGNNGGSCPQGGPKLTWDVRHKDREDDSIE